jgi:hypothetical protein
MKNMGLLIVISAIVIVYLALILGGEPVKPLSEKELQVISQSCKSQNKVVSYSHTNSKTEAYCVDP